MILNWLYATVDTLRLCEIDSDLRFDRVIVTRYKRAGIIARSLQCVPARLHDSYYIKNFLCPNIISLYPNIYNFNLNCKIGQANSQNK